jgi:2'-hydroxyisoflavone reductase
MQMIGRRSVLKLGAAALATGLLPTGLEARAPRRILFLGGTGFIGPHIIHAALARGHQVAMMNRGRREPNQNAADFARVEAIRGDRSLPDAYANLAGKKWDVVIDTATNVAWTREAVTALKGSASRYVYISSTGVFLPYRTVDIPEDGPVPLTDSPPQNPPSFGVIKALSEQEVRTAMPGRELVIRPSYIVGPGDTSDRFTYWPMRMARGGEVLVPGRKGDFVQYVDVRDLAEWMVLTIETDTAGTFNVAGPAAKQTLAQFVDGLAPLAAAPLSFTWIDDYEWLKQYPLRKGPDGKTSGLTEAIPWVMPDGDDLGHTQISNRKAVAAGLTFRPLLTTARDTIAWRNSGSVPEALKKQPRYVMTPEQEQALLAAWKTKARGGRDQVRF